MKFFTTQDQTQIFYKDIGEGAPVILIHGWPLSADMWEEQIPVLLASGYRVIAYDRRGFGRSEQTATGYDYDTFSRDLHDLIEHLGIEKAALVGFSMGGGEIARYLSHYGTEHVSCVSLISSIVPIVGQKPDNPDGVPNSKLQEIEESLVRDRFDFFRSFFKDFYGVSMISHPTSDAVLDWAQMVAAQASLKATIDCVNAFGRTDFRKDMKAFTVPTLIIHGSSDKTVPIKTSAEQASKMIPSARFKIYDGAAHGLNVTHKYQLNQDLLDFLKHYSVRPFNSRSRRGLENHASHLNQH